MTAKSSFILVVDDDFDVREALCEALEYEGYQVHGVEHGRAALDYIKQRNANPCLILLDLMMPVMDGMAFREEQLKDPAIASIPVVLITAAGTHAASRVLADGVLHKPLRIESVIQAIETHCPKS
jgi:CheY-like chemotaxis protein